MSGTHVIIPGEGCLDCWSDPATYRIDVAGRIFLFDFSDMFGPLVVGRRGQEVKQPGARDPFWRAITLWRWQGKRVGSDGLCIWEEPPLEKLRHIGGRHWWALPDDATSFDRTRVRPLDECGPWMWKLPDAGSQTENSP